MYAHFVSPAELVLRCPLLCPGAPTYLAYEDELDDIKNRDGVDPSPRIAALSAMSLLMQMCPAYRRSRKRWACVQAISDTDYILHSVVCHSGSRMRHLLLGVFGCRVECCSKLLHPCRSGHYYCYVQVDGNWWYCSDEDVQAAELDMQGRKDACLLQLGILMPPVSEACTSTPWM